MLALLKRLVKNGILKLFQIIETQAKLKADEKARNEDEAAKVKAMAEEKARLEAEDRAKLEAEMEEKAKAEKQSQEKSYLNYYKALAEGRAKIKSEGEVKAMAEGQAKLKSEGEVLIPEGEVLIPEEVDIDLEQNNGLETLTAVPTAKKEVENLPVSSSMASTSTLSAQAISTGNIYLQCTLFKSEELLGINFPNLLTPVYHYRSLYWGP